MLVFLWILASMGVAYGAKISDRHAFWWFLLSIVFTPLAASAALWFMNRYGIKLIRPT